jgi:hypothetical protein
VELQTETLISETATILAPKKTEWQSYWEKQTPNARIGHIIGAILIAVVAIASLNGGGTSEKSSTAAARGSATTGTQRSAKSQSTIDAMDFSYALFAGADTNGKKKEAYLLEIQDTKVKLINAFVYGKDTSSESAWKLLIGDNTPRIICEQKTKESKMVIANLDKKLADATLEGDYSRFSGNILYLSNCSLL